VNDAHPPHSPQEVPDGADGNAERDADGGAVRYVLPLVVRLERTAPPARTDALVAAARAVLALLADERTEADGEWCEAVRLWEERGIRKVVRRARGAEWRRAEALPGVTVEEGTASVRVFPPVPLDGWPRDLARLQVSGTELTDPEPGEERERQPERTQGGARPEPGAGADANAEAGAGADAGAGGAGTPVLWLNPGLEMSAGKAMAQAAHGAQLAWWELPVRERARWRTAGFPLAVRTAADGRAWAELTGCGLPVVRDAGFTEVAPGSCTVVADHPALRADEPRRLDGGSARP
jgi:peptidyl-tRNA hydrolase